jgi:hypothetical protein
MPRSIFSRLQRHYWFCDPRPVDTTLARRIEVALIGVDRCCQRLLARSAQASEEDPGEGRALIDGLYRAAGVLLAEGHRGLRPEAAILRRGGRRGGR